MAHHFGIIEIDGDNAHQAEIALAILGPADFAFDGVASAQPEFADDLRRDVNIVGAREIIAVGRPQETKAIRHDFDGAGAGDFVAGVGRGLQNGENNVLLAQRRSVLDAEFLRHDNQVGGGFALEVV